MRHAAAAASTRHIERDTIAETYYGKRAPPGPSRARRRVLACRWHLIRHMKISGDDLVGRIVVSGDGIAIGEVTRLFVDSATWRVESLQVALRKESAERIGVKHGMFHKPSIEIATRLVQSVGDAVVLTIALDALRTPADPQPSEPSEPAPFH